MMRHSVIFAANVVEPDPSGVWVKHQEASEKISTLSMALKVQEQQLLALEREHKSLQAEHSQSTVELNAIINRLEKSLRSAKERLNLCAHAPECGSRYITRNGGEEIKGRCNCSLDQWMRENG